MREVFCSPSQGPTKEAPKGVFAEAYSVTVTYLTEFGKLIQGAEVTVYVDVLAGGEEKVSHERAADVVRGAHPGCDVTKVTYW